MDKNEFIKRLRDNKEFTNPDEMIEHRLPVVQYYLTHYTNAVLIANNRRINSKNITIEFNRETDFPLLNIAFDGIRTQLKLK